MARSDDSEAKKKADAKFNKKTYERLALVVRRDAKINGDFIRTHATSQGESMNGFVLRAIKEAIERDNAKVE